MILALSFLAADAIIGTRTDVPYIETVERITDSAYAIMGQSVSVNEPRVFRTRTGLGVLYGWFRQNIADNILYKQAKMSWRKVYRMGKAHRLVLQAEKTAL